MGDLEAIDEFGKIATGLTGDINFYILFKSHFCLPLFVVTVFLLFSKHNRIPIHRACLAKLFPN